MPTRHDWVTVDLPGVQEHVQDLVERRGFGIVIAELFQNAMDTDATECNITIAPLKGTRGVARLTVEDNDPVGFRRLADAYTMYLSSLKKDDPTKAGRYNVGEKLVLSYCREATVATTIGTVTFDDAGRHEYPRRKREHGTKFEALINCTKSQIEEAVRYMRRIIVRPNLKLVVNGEDVRPRTPEKVFQDKLPAPVGQYQKRVPRPTEVQLHQRFDPAEPWLYELGIPVCRLGDDKWDVNVMQRVPLNIDRDNVPGSFRQELRAVVLNHTYEEIEEEEAGGTWIKDGTSDTDRIAPQAFSHIVTDVLHPNLLIASNNDPESKSRATAGGHTVVDTRTFTEGQRKMLKKFGARTTHQAYPTHRINTDLPPPKKIEHDAWTRGMVVIHDYAVALAKELMGIRLEVEFCDRNGSVEAQYHGGSGAFGRLTFYVETLGWDWFNQDVTQEVDELLIHEFAHHTEGNHLCERYYKACCKLGAQLKWLALKEPEFFAGFKTSSGNCTGQVTTR